ncbi:phosphopantetheine-binding protein, partial [uncultured Algibacter sp.]|uniref:phosphopantetheine-binding protein n=1 Tax=uncultured Algibacter sp. TaxID=298659 RepID=UPI00261F4BC7
MTEEKLKYKIEQLTDNELKLLKIKIKDFIKIEAKSSKTDKHKKIVAYVETDSFLDKENLKAHLKRKLPDYMIPTSFFELEKIPLLPNGKVNKKEILKSKLNNTEGGDKISITEPTTEIEKKLVKIWEDVLDFFPISTQDNFFEIGGDSILSIQITSKIRKLEIEINPNDLFENQSIKELANFIESQKTKSIQKNTFKHLINVKDSGSLPPLFCIHGGGRHFFFYNPLSTYINPNRPLYAVQSSEVEENIILHESITHMANDFVKEIKAVSPKGPYHIMGYC